MICANIRLSSKILQRFSIISAADHITGAPQSFCSSDRRRSARLVLLLTLLVVSDQSCDQLEALSFFSDRLTFMPCSSVPVHSIAFFP